MVTLNVFLKVKKDQREAYLELINDLIEASNQEEGCLLYAHYESTSDENEFIIVENWASQGAIDKHNKTAHFGDFVSKIDDLISEELSIKES